MKAIKIICIITNIMFAITAGVLDILAVNMIRIMNVAVKIRDIINNNVTSALSYIYHNMCVHNCIDSNCYYTTGCFRNT